MNLDQLIEQIWKLTFEKFYLNKLEDQASNKFVEICSDDEVAKLKELLNDINVNDLGCDVNKVDPYGNGITLLHIFSAINASSFMAKFLQIDGIKIDELDKYGETPLHFAAKFGNLEAAKLLASQNSTVNIIDLPNFMGVTPLYRAAENNYIEVVKFLLENGANAEIAELLEDKTPLQVAKEQKNEEMIKVFEKINCNKIDIVDDVIDPKPIPSNIIDNQPIVNTNIAVNKMKVSEIINKIYNAVFIKFSELDSESKTNTNFVKICSSEEVKDIKRSLEKIDPKDLEYDITYFDKPNRGMSLLHFLTLIDATTLVGKILNLDNAEINAQDLTYGYTALHYAVDGGNFEMVKLLLKNGAYIDAKNKFKNTPLYNAVKNGQTLIIEYLLKEYANHDIKNGLGIHSLKLAEDIGNKDIIDLFDKYIPQIKEHQKDLVNFKEALKAAIISKLYPIGVPDNFSYKEQKNLLSNLSKLFIGGFNQGKFNLDNFTKNIGCSDSNMSRFVNEISAEINNDVVKLKLSVTNKNIFIGVAIISGILALSFAGTALMPQLAKFFPQLADNLTKDRVMFSTNASMIEAGSAVFLAIISGITAGRAISNSKEEQKEVEKAVRIAQKYVNIRVH